MSMMNLPPSPFAMLPPEDAATIPPEDIPALIERGALSPSQPGLRLPGGYTPPVETATPGGGGVGGDVGGGVGGSRVPGGGIRGTGGMVDQAELDREAEDERRRLDREQSQRQFDETVGQRRENAFSIISSFLQRAGLTGLETNIRGLLSQGIEDTDAILFNLRGTEQFKTRFKGNAARATKGLPELDPATYIGLEQQYASILRSNGLPSNFYDSPDDFAALIEGDVSPAEFQGRIQEGFTKVKQADPQVLATLRNFYPEVGSDDRALAAYFIDPRRAAQLLERQVEAARIGARAQEQGGMAIGAGTAEELVARGYTAEQAQGVFQRVGQLGGLYQEMGGEQALTEAQKVGAAFGFNVEAQQALERRQRQRLAEFEGGGGFARTTGATSGTVETGLGTAQ